MNLSYLILAQRLLRANVAKGIYRLGLDEDAAQLLSEFTLPQILKLASSNVLLCKFRLNDYQLLSALNRDGLDGSLLAAHATLLLSNSEQQDNELVDN
ncbi:transcriptional activator FlhD [Pusillimonas sp. T7-7]|nr:transcriptional activator FlhD [Pusillimonas sp. T7-7]